MLLLGCICQTNAQVWKHDIHFENVTPGSEVSHIVKGTIDQNDHTYLLKQLNNGSQGEWLFLQEYLPDGSNGFQTPLGPVNSIYPFSHNSCGITTDQQYVYVAIEYHPTNPLAPHLTKVLAIQRTNPTVALQIAEMYGVFRVTDMTIHNNLLYVYGNTEDDLEFLVPSTSLTLTNGGQQESVLLEINVSGVTPNHQEGVIDWIRKVTYNANAESGNVAVADNGLIYLSGMADKLTRIGNNTGGFYHTVNFTTAQSAGFVARFLSTGAPDPNFQPIVISNFQNPLNSTLHQDNIEDIQLDPQTDHLYLVVRNRIRKYSTSAVGNPPLVWSQDLPGLVTNSNRLAISQCNEMYVAGIRIQGATAPQFTHYYVQSLNKQTGAITTTMVSNDGTHGGNSQGEVILIQSDGDKVVAGDYDVVNPVGGNYFYVDYESISSTPLNYPSITYDGNAFTGSFIGIYDDGVKGELTNDFVLTNSSNVATNSFPCWQSIYLNGSASTNETNHYIDLWKLSGGTYQWFGSLGWLGGQAGTDNVSQLAQAAGIQLTPGNYQIKFAVQNNCVGWLEKVVNFTITTETLTPTFSLTTIDNGTTFGVTCTATGNPPHAEHMWYIFNVTTGTIVQGSMINWAPGVTSYARSGLSKQNTTYRVIHIVRDPRGCAAQVNNYIQVSMLTRSGLETLDEPTLTADMQEIESQLLAVSNQATNALSTDNISVYPNPTDGVFTLDYHYDQDAEVTLHSATGQAFLAKAITPNSLLSLDLTHFAPGVYFLTVHTADGHQVTQRVVRR